MVQEHHVECSSRRDRPRQVSAGALIYWAQGRVEAARKNADMAVRFGNIRRNGFVVTYDKDIVRFDDKAALKRLLAVLNGAPPQ